MFLEEEGVELRGWCTVWVAALRTPSIRAPHVLQNSLSWGGAAEHDGQSFNWLSFPVQLIYQGQMASAIVQRNPSYGRVHRPMKVVERRTMNPLSLTEIKPPGRMVDFSSLGHVTTTFRSGEAICNGSSIRKLRSDQQSPGIRNDRSASRHVGASR